MRRSQILIFVDRTSALIKGEERKVELEFLKAARSWCEGSEDLPVLYMGNVRIVDDVSDLCDMLTSLMVSARQAESGKIEPENKQELTTLKEVISQNLGWLEDRANPVTLLDDVLEIYPGEWGVNEDSRWIYMVVGDQISVVVSREEREEGVEDDLIVRCIVHSHYNDGSEIEYATMKSLPQALANSIVQVVALPRDTGWVGDDQAPNFDPELIPDWLKEPLKEALRPEHERIDKMFRGL